MSRYDAVYIMCFNVVSQSANCGHLLKICSKPILQTCENACEQMHITEGGTVVNYFGKLLKHLHFGSILPQNHIAHFNVCVLSTRDFCCLSDDWMAAKFGPAHSSHSQAQVMFFCSFPFANN